MLRRVGREEAIRQSSWEIVRDCDFHESLALRDAEMFVRLHYGTPHESYRARLAMTAAGAGGS